MQNNSAKFKMKKSLAWILLLMILLSSVSFYPRKAGAIAHDATWWNQLIDTATNVGEFAKIAGEIVLNIATATFRKMILDMIVDEIIAWISGEGTSAFDTGDWEQFLDNAVQNASDLTLQEIAGPEVEAALCDGNWAGQVNFILQKPKRFAQKARCTLEDIKVNYNEFIDNFENGGWAAWIKISESQNNPYGYFLSAMDEKLMKETKISRSIEKELTASGGFLSDKVCIQAKCQIAQIIFGTPISSDSEGYRYKIEMKEEEMPESCSCEKSETRAPGKIMADTLSKTVFRDVDWLQNNPEWTNYLTAIGNAIVNRLTKQGVKAIKPSIPKDSPSSANISRQADYTAPLTSAKILDPWRVKLTANEPGKTYYSLDGSNPSQYRSFEYKGNSMTIINSTVIGAMATQLKWMSIDDNFNKENSRSLPSFLRTPFKKTKLDAYIDSQDTSIPDEIQKALIKFFRDEENGNEAKEISEETFIPKDLRLNLINYLEIEDLRVEMKRPTLLNTKQRGELDAILATYNNDFDLANDAELTDLIATLEDIGITFFVDLQTSAEEIRDRRDNLQKVLSYLNGTIKSLEKCSEEQAAAEIKEDETPEEFALRTADELADCQKAAEADDFPVNLTGLSSALATDSLFSELKEKVDKIIVERSLITIDPAGDWTTPTAAMAPADSEHVAILSVNPSNNKPTATFFKQISWDDKPGARDLAFNQSSNNHINGFYYKQAFAIPPTNTPFGTQIWYGAIDTDNKWTEEKGIEFNQSFEGLPPITNLVNPIAEIKTPVKDSDGYFILDPSSSIDVDSTPFINGYEWEFINETSATATPRYDFEIFDLNRDGDFEETQCLYKIKTTITWDDKTAGIKYYDAAHSSPYNSAPNVAQLTLDLPEFCETGEKIEAKYYLKSTSSWVPTKEITKSEYDNYILNPSLLSPDQSVSEDKGSSGTGAYESMKIVDADNGIIKVKFTAKSEPVTIGLRVTDDEGLTATAKSVVINP